MRQRLGAVLRRLREHRAMAALLRLATLPPRAGAERIVARSFYGLSLGTRFDDDRAAAVHYFRTGWYAGLVPNPLIDAASVRFSLPRAWLLRNRLALISWVGGSFVDLGRPSRFLDTAAVPEPLQRATGNAARLLTLPSAVRDTLPLRFGDRRLDWAQASAAAEAGIPAAAIVLRERLIDRPFYEAQLGGARARSAAAMLEDYIVNGEWDGRAPNAFFEPEWHAAHARAQLRSGRPLNQLLAFVTAGERGEAGPQFSGEVYLRDQVPVGVTPVSLLGHFLRTASPERLTPAGSGVQPMTVRRAHAIAVRAIRDALFPGELGNGGLHGAIRLARRSAGTPGRVLVLIDGRRLHRPDQATAIRAAVLSQNTAVEYVVLSTPTTKLPSDVLAFIDTSAVVRLVEVDPAVTSVGAVARSLAGRPDVDAWTVWTPTQQWEPGYLEALAGQLAVEPDAHAVIARAATLGQDWMHANEPVWAPAGPDGVVFRAQGGAALLPDIDTDFGFGERAALTLLHGGSAVIVDHAPITIVTPHRNAGPYEDAFIEKSARNEARAPFLVRWERQGRGGVAISMPVFEDWRMTLDAVAAVYRTTRAEQAEIVVVDNGSRRAVTAILTSVLADFDRVRLVRLPSNTDFATASNLGAALTSAETVVFLNNDTLVQPGWLAPLLAALDAGAAAAQPLLLYPDRTVQTAGTVFSGGMSMPTHLLVGTHIEDVPEQVADAAFSALTAACVAVRRTDVERLGGFDPGFLNGMEDVDFFLRLRAAGRPLRVVPSSRVIHLESKTVSRHRHGDANRWRFLDRWERTLVHELDDRQLLAGSELEVRTVRWLPQHGSPLRVPDWAIERDGTPVHVEEGAPRLRWAIKAATSGRTDGDSWGDEFFSQDLAAALRRLGQDVVVDRSSSHVRNESDTWDQVTLTLRGLVPFTAQPDAINLLWVISHPDDVTVAEVAGGFDRVYAAGETWARNMSARSGIPIATLLQATDATRFHPDAADDQHRYGALFVGRTRGVPRQIVRDVIATGHEVDVFGDDGWEHFIDPRFVRGSLLANAAAPAAYASAQFVLNDHWRDMAALGFLSNRLFDAAAAGARIISDPVPGMAAVFGAQVQTYASRDELAALLEPANPIWPDDATLRQLAAGIARDHSFDARAATLLDDVLELRARRGGAAQGER